MGSARAGRAVKGTEKQSRCDGFGVKKPPAGAGQPAPFQALLQEGAEGGQPGGEMATKARGYAARPGTGPAGETCATCRHCVCREMGSRWYKCGKVRHLWTGGVKTDIRTGAPACEHWERLPEGEDKPRAGRLNMKPWDLAPDAPPCAPADPNQIPLFNGDTP